MAGENLLNQVYKDHTVQNPVEDLRIDNLPLEAISIHNQTIRNIYTTIQIIDEKTGKVIETITGRAENGSLKADAESLVRRTLELTLAVDDNTFPQEGSLIWFNNIARVYMGIADNSNKNKIFNFLLGTFWITSGGYSINGVESRIKVSFQDKMSKWDESQLQFPIKINRETPINEAMRAFMEHIGETQFGFIQETLDTEVVPYTLEFKTGDSITNVIKAFRDMYMDYTCGYDVQGRFEFRKIENQREQDLDEPKWRFDSEDNGTMKSLISFSETYNLKAIKNKIIVYGHTSEKTGITAMGESRVTDGKSPFNVYSIGERIKILSEDKFVTDEQCIAKARYEIFKNSNFQEKCTIDSVPIYFLDVNDVITVVHPKTKQESKYMVDSFSFGLGVSGTMTIEAHKLYFISLEYGEDKHPIIDAFIRGIYNNGWISLAEERIARCYNMVASGTANLTVRFQEDISGGEQMSVTSYATTRNQTLMIDLADYSKIDLEDENGFVDERSRGDSAERVMAHEMFHAVLNDYVGHDKAILVPTFFNEGFAEFIHGAKERFESVFDGLSKTEKKNRLINLCSEVMNGNFTGASEDYVASYLCVIAIYRVQTERQFSTMFQRIAMNNNVGINFLSKVIPIGNTDSEVKEKLLQEIRTMDEVWKFLFDLTDKDTGSIGGVHFMNIYGTPLTDTTIFNNIASREASIGFNIQIIK